MLSENPTTNHTNINTNNNTVRAFVALAGIFGFTSIGTLFGGKHAVGIHNTTFKNIYTNITCIELTLYKGFGFLFISNFLSEIKETILWLWAAFWKR